MCKSGSAGRAGNGAMDERGLGQGKTETRRQQARRDSEARTRASANRSQLPRHFPRNIPRTQSPDAIVGSAPARLLGTGRQRRVVGTDGRPSSSIFGGKGMLSAADV